MNPELCYCDDPITPHRVRPEWDCYCDGACVDDCPCHQDADEAAEQARAEGA